MQARPRIGGPTSITELSVAATEPADRMRPARSSSALRWPLPALYAWLLSWALYALLLGAGGPLIAALIACSCGVVLSRLATAWWRRLIIAGGFPLSLALSGAAAFPAWLWLLLLLLLLLVYPLNAWRDAPLFPTPAHALAGLPALVPLPPGAALLDAGCGLGHGLQALREAYPQAALHGVEWSWPLRWICALRCPWAHIRHGDLWRCDWRRYALIYLFQRPESMPRAVAKARAELAPGAWLISLEFEASELRPSARLELAGGRPLWLYRAPFEPAERG